MLRGQASIYHLKRWIVYYPLKPNYWGIEPKYKGEGAIVSNHKGATKYEKVTKKKKILWSLEVILNPKQWFYKFKEFKNACKLYRLEIKSIKPEKQILKVLKDNPKQQQIDIWYEENQELSDLCDYMRSTNQNWQSLDYLRKLQIYCISNQMTLHNEQENNVLEIIKSKLGRHDIYQSLFNKFYGTGEWSQVRENLINLSKKVK